MKTFLSSKRVIILGLILGSSVVQSHASLIISNFSSQNPLAFGFVGTTWATPINQFDSFTFGSTSGQEVLPLSGGNPTVSGGAGVLGLNLNISGNDEVELTARLLSGNLATQIQVLLFDSDGTVVRFSFPISDFNFSTFSPGIVSFSSATTVAAGSTPGFNMGNVTTYEVQGDFFDGGGAAPFRAQFDELAAVTSAPEPSSGGLVSLGAGLVLLLLFIKPRVHFKVIQ
jgi:hypothetical protein